MSLNCLQACNSTCWNFKFYMLKSILAVKEDKLNELDCPQKLSTLSNKFLRYFTVLHHINQVK
jgi:hypothetical protein